MKLQRDSKGATWRYLADNAYSWVQLDDARKPSIIRYSDTALQQLIDDASKTLQADPHNVDAYLTRANAYTSQHHFDKAGADYEAVQPLAQNDVRLYDGLGTLSLKQHRSDQRDLQQALKLQPKRAGIVNRIGRASAQDGNYVQAIKSYTQAIALAPDNGLLYVTLGDTYTKQGIRIEPFRNILKRSSAIRF